MPKFSKEDRKKHKKTRKKKEAKGNNPHPRTIALKDAARKRKTKTLIRAEPLETSYGSSKRRRPNDWKKKMRKKERKRRYFRQDWFWGMITQTEAEGHLKDCRHGEFLVRSMLFQDNPIVVIDVVVVSDKSRTFQQFQASPVVSKWQLDSYPSRHKTLVDLVAYYNRHFIGMTGLKLKTAAKQPDWFLKSYNIMCPKNAVNLGSGQYGCVAIGAYRRRLVAIKKLTSSGERLLLDREALLKEAMFMQKLQHPYITKIIGISIDKTPPMLLIELMACPLLDHLQKYGKYTTIGEKLLYLWQLARGLSFMAKENVVHRDIAARNVLFSRHGIVKVSDLGLSDYESKLQAVNTSKERLPRAWLPPESVSKTGGNKFNEKTDVWMFGATSVEVFQNGQPPYHELKWKEALPRLQNFKDGDNLLVFPKYASSEIHAFYSTKVFKRVNEDRVNFEEITSVLDNWLNIKFPPPSLEKRTVNMIPNCHPLTNAEYEILYQNNMDWLPAVRKVKRKREEREKSKTIKSSTKKKKKAQEVLKMLKRKLIRKRKRRRIQIKLQMYREQRREHKRKFKALIAFYLMYPQREVPRRKKIRAKHEYLVDIYSRILMAKWRKQAPTRRTRLRLRRHRLINKKSKHKASRNGKLVRIKKKTKRVKRGKFVRPLMPRIPKFVAKKKKLKKVDGKKVLKRKEIVLTLKVRKASTAKKTKKAMQEKKRKRLRAKRRLRRFIMRKRLKKKLRKRYRGAKRRRKRQKYRLRYRKKKYQLRKGALNMEQKERMRELKKRRRMKKQKIDRLHRNRKIGQILREWRVVRKLLMVKRARRTLKKKMRKKVKQQMLKKMEEAAAKENEKEIRKTKKKSKDKKEGRKEESKEKAHKKSKPKKSNRRGHMNQKKAKRTKKHKL